MVFKRQKGVMEDHISRSTLETAKFVEKIILYDKTKWVTSRDWKQPNKMNCFFAAEMRSKKDQNVIKRLATYIAV